MLIKIQVQWQLTPLITADNAVLLMNTNGFATFETCPSDHLLFNEISYTELLYVLKIINHAHTVFCSVSSVEVVKPAAGVLPAIEAIPQISSLEHFALFYPAQSPGFWLQFVVAPAPRTRVLFPDIGAAEAAVHPAGSDQPRRY